MRNIEKINKIRELIKLDKPLEAAFEYGVLTYKMANHIQKIKQDLLPVEIDGIIYILNLEHNLNIIEKTIK